MTKKKHENFKKPPITEAVFDIRVELPKKTTLEKLKKMEKSIDFEISEKKNTLEMESVFKISQEAIESEKHSSQINGCVFKNNPDNKIVQCRLNGFTFNKLKPYSDWNQFYSEAQKYWNIYYKIAKPVKILRIALRYINEIMIPLPFDDFKDYLKTIHEIAAPLPQDISQLFMRIALPKPDSSVNAIITETFKKPTKDYLPFIFDIDVFNNTPLDPSKWDIKRHFEELREYKNMIFCESITRKTKELFR